jgi:hypothetical protein
MHMDVTVLTGPVATSDAASTSENTEVEIDLLANDTDCTNAIDAGSVTVVSAPVNGTVSINPETGAATYLPAEGFAGTDAFTYSVCNAGGLCDEASVDIIVESTARAPYALNDINITFINRPVSGWVATNDIDPRGDDLTVNTTLVSNALNGSVVMNSNGSYTYTPNAGFSGTDFFTYEVCNPNGLCDEAVVSISVVRERIQNKNRQPVASDDNYFGKQDVPVTGNLMANDFDPDEDAITISTSPVTSPASGILEINSDGTFNYSPANGFTGTVEFEYEICDNRSPSLCNTAVATIDIREDLHENNRRCRRCLVPV